MTVEFEEPIVVRTAGTLFVGGRVPPEVLDTTQYSAEGPNEAACMFGVAYDGPETMWVYGEEWSAVTTERPDFRLTLGIHVEEP